MRTEKKYRSEVSDDLMDQFHPTLHKGRGTVSNQAGRFERYSTIPTYDAWQQGQAEKLKTTVTDEHAKHIITRNQSPDIPFDRSINAYRGCEHGCVYCFARPSHAYMGLSTGIDFESKLFAKPNAAKLLEAEITKPGYRPAPIAMGTNTDPYQPIERDRKITREILEVLSTYDHPCTLLTKSRLIVRDLDILAPMAERGLVKVGFSVTTLDPKLSQLMEPRAVSPQRRLDAIRLLSDAGVPVGVMFAPVIPALNDHEMEAVLSAAAHAGATEAAYILLRLPREVAGLFSEWLETHFPDRKKRVLGRLMALKNGKLNDPRFKHRMKGHGLEADLLKQRFDGLCRRLQLNLTETAHTSDALKKPVLKGGQFDMLDMLGVM